MADQIQKGHTYADGDVVNAAGLNELVDEAEVLKGTIAEQTVVTANPADYVLITDTSDGGNLKRSLVSTLPSGVTSIGLTVAPTTVFESPGTSPITTTGTFQVSLKTQTVNKVLAGPATGGPVAPSFRTLGSADLTPPAVAISVLEIDWSLGNVFYKTLADDSIFTFSNIRDGQTIKVRIRQTVAGDATVTWNTGSAVLNWVDGVTPEVTTTPNGFSMFVFTAIIAGGTTRIIGFKEHAPYVYTPPAISFTEVTGNTFDMTLNNVFRKILPGSASSLPLKLDGGTAGQRATIYLIQNAPPGNPVTWDTVDPTGVVRWPGGVDHTMTVGSAGRTDIINFLCMGSELYYGTFDKDFTP